MKTLSHHIQNIQTQKTYVGGQCLCFKWVKQKNLSTFNKDFIKKYDENSKNGYFFDVDIDYPK